MNATTATAEKWSFNKFDDLETGYHESRLSVVSKDLTTAFDLVCNKYGVQLLITATSWKPAFYDVGLSWVSDAGQGGRLDIPASDTLSGLRGSWPKLTNEGPKRLINAINKSDSITFNFSISGKVKSKIIVASKNTNESLGLFLNSCSI